MGKRARQTIANLGPDGKAKVLYCKVCNIYLSFEGMARHLALNKKKHGKSKNFWVNE